MGIKFEMWRAADRTAHEAELHFRTLMAPQDPTPPGECERVQALRRTADQLFDDAMLEIDAEVRVAIAKSNLRASEPRP